MAEIELQKKKAPIWPWIIGLIIAALLVWALVSYFYNDDKVNETVQPVMHDTVTQPADNTVAATGAIGAFTSWANNSESAEMGPHHNYTAEGLRKLSAAIEELANRKYNGDADVSSAVNTLKSNADQIQENWKATDHANEIKAAFLAAANALEKMQQKSNTDLNPSVSDLKSKANNINKETLTLEQKGDVKGFFQTAGQVLEQLNR